MAGHELVYGELLIGDRGAAADFWPTINAFIKLELFHIRKIVSFVRHRKLHGRGVGWIDVPFVGIRSRVPIKAVDGRPSFRSRSHEIGVAYEAPISSQIP